MTSRWQPPGLVRQRFDDLLELAQAAEGRGDIDQAWGYLADAHVVTQPWALPHVRVHVAMLCLGVRIRSGQEIVGQLARLVLAAPGSLSHRYPVGNSGRANVSAFTPAPVRSDLAELLSDARSSSEEVRDAAGVQRLYDRIAPLYDLASAPYWMLGADKLSDKAIAELRLTPGSTVVELGVGTGRNLVALSRAVGPTGRVVGVDLSTEMLRRARKRLVRTELGNVILVTADMMDYEPPPETSGVLSTYAIEMLPDPETLLRRLSYTLPAGSRIAISGLRASASWPDLAIRLGSLLMRPFGVNAAYRAHQPWVAIETQLDDTVYREAFGGVIYLAAGTARSGGTNTMTDHPAVDRTAVDRTESELSSHG